MPPLAVLFDFDGVIADTENVHVVAWERTFALMGWDVPPETCARAAEEDDRLFLKEVFASRGIDDGDVAGWVARKQGETVAMLRACPRIYPGVSDLVAMLRPKARLAVVSGTWRENVETVMKAAGLASSFEVIVTKEDFERPKPAPDAYLRALRILDVPPDRAIALEDSPSGLEAARASGVRAVAVGHRRPSPEWAEGAEFVPSLAVSRGLPKWFR